MHRIIVIFIVAAFATNCADGKRTYTDEDLETWDAPAEIKRDFPFYLSGPDYEGQPVFVLENGKWPIRKIFTEGTREAQQALDKYCEQMFYTWSKTAREFENGTGKFSLIADFEGYSPLDLAHLPTVTFVLVNVTLRFQSEEATRNLLDSAYIVNMNYVAETLLSLAKPVLGELFSRFEFGGTNKERWIPKLLRKIPRESLAPWYGGSADFKPLAVYG